MTTADYVVIGAGSAGCVLANRLSAGNDTILLEAGGSSRAIGYRLPLAATKLWMNPKSCWCLWSEAEPGLGGRKLPVPRGKALGGSSAINGTVYNRGSPADYHMWAANDLPGWDYDSLLPYFTRIEDHWRGGDEHHGSGGEVAVSPIRSRSPFADPFLAAVRQLNLPTSEDHLVDAEGVGMSDFNVNSRGRRVSASDAFVHPIRNRKTLNIECHAHVTRIVVEDGRATGVEFRRGGQLHRVHARREVILAAGAVGSPQILQLSGIGNGSELRDLGIEVRHDLPAIGEGFNDQPGGSFEFRARLPLSFDRNLRADRFAFVMLRWLFGLGGPAAAAPGIGMGAIRTTADQPWPDLRMMLAAGTRESKVWFPGISHTPEYKLLLNFAVAHPYSSGSIKLRSSDPMEAPLIRYNLLCDPRDIESMKSHYRLMRELVAQPAFADIAGDLTRPDHEIVDDQELEDYLRSIAGTTAHPMGSCRMGADGEAVVDGHCRLRGIAALRVVDASIFPVQISGNPHAAIMAVADRASDLILREAADPLAAGLGRP